MRHAFWGLNCLEQNHLKISHEFNLPIGEIECQTRYPIPNPAWSVAPLNQLMKSSCQAFGAVLLHFRCICCAAQHVRANLIPQAGVQLPESQRTNVSTRAAYQNWENGLAYASTSSCCHVVRSIDLFFCLSRWSLCIRLSIYCVALFGLASFIQMNTFQVAECICSHPANRICFAILPRYFFVLKITSRSKRNQLP